MLFESHGHTYSSVCGHIQGYSYNTPSAFNTEPDTPLSGDYVDGVSITYGTPPTHIWTYAAGNVVSENSVHSCPCNVNGSNSIIPQYVGGDYYCEAASESTEQRWYTNDLLWDGMQCAGLEGPCCNHTGLPWFNKKLSSTTTADIKVRVCLDMDVFDENIGIQLMDLFVK